MKTVNDLFAVLGEAQMQNVVSDVVNSHWFFNYSGHVNKMSVKFIPSGWKRDNSHHSLDCEVNFENEDSVQAGYWFIKSNLINKNK